MAITRSGNTARGGQPRIVKFQLIRDAFEKLGKVDITVTDDGGARQKKAVNRESTVRNKIGTLFNFAKKFLQIRKNIANPTKDQVESLDWREIFRNGSPGVIAFIKQAYDNDNTRNTVTGYLKSAIDQIKYRSFGWLIQDYTKFNDFMLEQAQSIRAARAQNPVPQILQDNPEITWSKLLEIEKKWREDNFASAKHLQLALRVLLAPKRDDTYSRLKYVARLPANNPENSKWNYVLISDDDSKPVKMDFRRSKTSDAYPRMLLNLDTGKDELAVAGSDNNYSDVCPNLKILQDILRASYRERPRTFVLSTTGSDSFSASRTHSVVQDTIEEAVGVRLGIRELRRLGATWAWSQQNWTANMRNKFATLMEHSLTTATTYNLPGREEVYVANDDDIPLAIRRKAQDADKFATELQQIRDAIKEAVNTLRAVI